MAEAKDTTVKFVAPFNAQAERVAARALTAKIELNCRLCNRTIDGGPVLVGENLYCSFECATVARREGLRLAGQYLVEARRGPVARLRMNYSQATAPTSAYLDSGSKEHVRRVRG